MPTKESDLVLTPLRSSAMTAFIISLPFLFSCAKTGLAQTWQPLPHSPVQGKADLVAADPANPHNLFIGAHGRLYTSFDEGKNWKELASLGSNTTINQVLFDKDRLLILTSEGMLESGNYGKSWRKIFSRLGTEQNTLALSRDPAHPEILYLGTEGGLFKKSLG